MNSATVLITGALSGIGRTTAFAFAKEGANIMVCGHSDVVGLQLVVELRATGIKADFIVADVTDESQVR